MFHSGISGSCFGIRFHLPCFIVWLLWYRGFFLSESLGGWLHRVRLCRAISLSSCRANWWHFSMGKSAIMNECPEEFYCSRRSQVHPFMIWAGISDDARIWRYSQNRIGDIKELKRWKNIEVNFRGHVANLCFNGGAREALKRTRLDLFVLERIVVKRCKAHYNRLIIGHFWEYKVQHDGSISEIESWKARV